MQVRVTMGRWGLYFAAPARREGFLRKDESDSRPD